MGLGLKFKARNALNTIKSTMKIGDYWYWLADVDLPAEIPIKPLVFPLRYDILIRKSFFDFYADHHQLYHHDTSAFVDLAQGHDYYKWFTKVLLVRYEKDRLADPQLIRELFSDRVRHAAALHDSIKSRGFDTRFPIIPFTGETILSTSSGKPSTEKFFMGDGCHRLACLMSQGYTALPRNMVHVKCFRRLSPFDNTTMLAEHLDIDWPEMADPAPGGGVP